MITIVLVCCMFLIGNANSLSKYLLGSPGIKHSSSEHVLSSVPLGAASAISRQQNAEQQLLSDVHIVDKQFIGTPSNYRPINDSSTAADGNSKRRRVIENSQALSSTFWSKHHQLIASQQLNEHKSSAITKGLKKTQSRRGRYERVRRALATDLTESSADCSYPCSEQRGGVLRCTFFDADVLALCQLAHSQIVEVDLSDTFIPYLEAEAFSGGVQHIVRVRLDGATISRLAANVFTFLPALRLVSIRGVRGPYTDILNAISQSNSVKEVFAANIATTCTCAVQEALRRLQFKFIVIVDSQLLNDCAVAQICEKTDLSNAGRPRIDSSSSSVMDFFHALKDIAQVSNGEETLDVGTGKSVVSVMYANTDRDSVYEELAKHLTKPIHKTARLSSIGFVASSKLYSNSTGQLTQRSAENNRGLRDAAVSPLPATASPTNNGSMRSVIGEIAVDAAKWVNSVMSQRIATIVIISGVFLVACCVFPCVVFCLAARCVRKRWRQHVEQLIRDSANDIDLADDPEEDLLPPMPILPCPSVSQARGSLSAGSRDKAHPDSRRSLSVTSGSKHIKNNYIR